jgi:hypothetical protein
MRTLGVGKTPGAKSVTRPSSEGVKPRSTPAQSSLGFVGPADRDPFRFIWPETTEGVRPWIEHRKRGRAGVMVALGRKRVAVVIDAASVGHLLVAQPYIKLERSRSGTP